MTINATIENSILSYFENVFFFFIWLYLDSFFTYILVNVNVIRFIEGDLSAIIFFMHQLSNTIVKWRFNAIYHDIMISY